MSVEQPLLDVRTSDVNKLLAELRAG
ncbi:MAG: hypothetical protein K0S86_5165, partial [Geminicoccaceae bacterium]|nr:hypothetical protein [Geminicoccaceae bacterium]